MTNCLNYLKYGGMTHHLSCHLLKTQDTEPSTADQRGPPRRGTSRAHLAQPRHPGAHLGHGSGLSGCQGRGASRGAATRAPGPGRRGRGQRPRTAGRARRQVPDGRGPRVSGGRWLEREAGGGRAARDGLAAGLPGGDRVSSARPPDRDSSPW